MSATLPVALTSNVYRSTMLLRLGGELSRDRFFDAGESLPSVFSRRARLVPTVVANLGTHATRRDLRHSSGATVGVTSTVDLWSDEERRRALLANVRIFSRSIPGTGGSLSLFGGFLWQNRPAVYNLDLFLPRGLEDTFLDRGSFVKYGVDLVQPLVYVDDGWLLLPVFLHAVYAYGFAESVKSTSDFSLDFDSVGGGIGLQMRLLHTLGVDIRFGAAYHPDTGETTAVFR